MRNKSGVLGNEKLERRLGMRRWRCRMEVKEESESLRRRS